MHIMIYFSFSTDSIIPWIALLNKCSLFVFTQFISHLQRKENSCYIMLKAARAALDISQAELAKRVNVSRQTIVAIEKGDYNPTIKLCIAICHELGKTLDELFWE